MTAITTHLPFIKPQNSLAIFSYGMILLGLLLLCLMAFDSQQILGINRWIKPTKFAFSIAVFGLTMNYFLSFFADNARLIKRLGQNFAGLMLIEISLIVMQAARGTTSHFNITTIFDAAVFQTMGVAILINTILVGYLTWLFFRRELGISPALLWAIRLGLIIFILASIEGGFMAAYNSHSVGNADGAVGLPFLNWNRIGGDLRVAHFFGLHAIQALPFAAICAEKLQQRFSSISPVVAVFAIGGIWFALTLAVFIQAILGLPLL